MEATCDRKPRKETVSPTCSNALELDLNKSPDGGQNAGDILLGPLICALPAGLSNDPSDEKNLGLDNSPEEGESGAAMLPPYSGEPTTRNRSRDCPKLSRWKECHPDPVLVPHYQ